MRVKYSSKDRVILKEVGFIDGFGSGELSRHTLVLNLQKSALVQFVHTVVCLVLKSWTVLFPDFRMS